MNKELEIEAENYAKPAENIDIFYQNGLFYGFIAGATSKYVEKQKLEFAEWTHLKGLYTRNGHNSKWSAYDWSPFYKSEKANGLGEITTQELFKLYKDERNSKKG